MTAILRLLYLWPQDFIHVLPTLQQFGMKLNLAVVGYRFPNVARTAVQEDILPRAVLLISTVRMTRR